ncbi:NAD(P)/FAD-dependent oxidoreductase [Massilia sp. W12]|uniref:phytoene desaturase family protein n=1 Tax=Massilia sp. W12 TaxID=3126507 RepID=UPI0030CBC69A
MSTQKQSVIIIGAGMSGLSTGVYAQMNNYQCSIYELHDRPGGCCTAWDQNEYIFDPCITWLNGCGGNGDDEMSQIWLELNALDGKKITHAKVFNTCYGLNGEVIRFYTDPDRLQQHLIEFSPEDEKEIKDFCKIIRHLQKAARHYPFLKSPGLQSKTEKALMILKLLPYMRTLIKALSNNLHDYSRRFRHPFLREAINYVMYDKHDNFPVFPSCFSLACAGAGNAGVPEGGSMGLVRSIEQRFIELGGRVYYDKKVAGLIIKEHRVVGVRMWDGQEHYADKVVNAADGYNLLYNMLEGKYIPPKVAQLYEAVKSQPEEVLFPSLVMMFLGVNADYSELPTSATIFLTEEEKAQLTGLQHDVINIQIRSQPYPELAPQGKSVLYVEYFSDRAVWQELDARDNENVAWRSDSNHISRKRSAAYKAEKKRLRDVLIDIMDKYYPGLKANLEKTDVSTPLSFERYTQNHQGTIYGWNPFHELIKEMEDETAVTGPKLPGLQGLYMAGHWTRQGGGLINAAASGRHAVQYMCRDDGVKFKVTSRQNEDFKHRWIDETPAILGNGLRSV